MKRRLVTNNRKAAAVLAIALAAGMALGMTGCGSGTEELSVSDLVGTEETEPEAEETEDLSVTEEPEEAVETAEVQGQASDVSGAVKAWDTTKEGPARVGQWIETASYSGYDKNYHAVYMRVNNVVTASDDMAYIQEAIDASNAVSYDFDQIDLSDYDVPSDVEWCLMEYEVYVPDDFPVTSEEYGWITAPDISPRQENIDGGGFPTADGTASYVGMGSNILKLDNGVDSYYPGNTYTFSYLYEMVKGYEGYVFTFLSYPDGTGSSDGESYYGYIACS